MLRYGSYRLPTNATINPMSPSKPPIMATGMATNPTYGMAARTSAIAETVTAATPHPFSRRRGCDHVGGSGGTGSVGVSFI